MNNPLKQLIARALAEDIGTGDITTQAIVPSSVRANASIVCKHDLVVSGLDVARDVFTAVDRGLAWKPLAHDGDRIVAGGTLATVHGSAAGLLTAERTALNFLQHLSGIATLTGRFVSAVGGSKTRIVDTRKTLPGLRALEKAAVVHGGGGNHRMGLYDRYLIKNNHIDIAGGVRRAIDKALAHRTEYALIEVEVRTMDELRDALEHNGVDIVMLDNWPIGMLDEAIDAARGHAMIEVSGGISLDNIADYARPGVDFISVGALTHSAPAADIHMRIEPAT